tara:strand:+ start:221 stop:640 length:420 start_codon:yes stop_codon:yes gene_type:complete
MPKEKGGLASLGRHQINYLSDKHIRQAMLDEGYVKTFEERANKNKKIINRNGFDTSSISFNIADAKSIKLQDKSYALFMFNPFGWETLSEFLSNNIEVLRKNNSVILYANDICVGNLLEFGRMVKRDNFFNLLVIAFGD